MSAIPALLTPDDFSIATGGVVPPGDPRLPALLDGAHRAIRRYCGWHVAPVVDTVDELHDGPGGRVLVLPTLRLEAVTALALRRSDHWEQWDAEALEHLEWSANGEIRLSGSWPQRFRSVKVSYRHGFEAAPDLVQVIQQVVANALASPMGATSEQAGALSVRWSTTAPGVSGGMSLLARDLATLDAYRLPGGIA